MEHNTTRKLVIHLFYLHIYWSWKCEIYNFKSSEMAQLSSNSHSLKKVWAPLIYGQHQHSIKIWNTMLQCSNWLHDHFHWVKLLHWAERPWQWSYKMLERLYLQTTHGGKPYLDLISCNEHWPFPFNTFFNLKQFEVVHFKKALFSFPSEK